MTTLLWPQTLLAYDITRPTVAENLALDEALLAAVEADSAAACLRFWESTEYGVVLGRSNDAQREVELAACRTAAVPVIRRNTGGGAVVIGPGCLCYSLVLPITDLLRSLGVGKVTSELMTRTAQGLEKLVPGVVLRGTSDLARDHWKFSGNAQRWLRKAFIHHGTLLYDFELTRLKQWLKHPTREPDYRGSRTHADFVTNLPRTAAELRQALIASWNGLPQDCPQAIIESARKIHDARYCSPDWNLGLDQ